MTHSMKSMLGFSVTVALGLSLQSVAQNFPSKAIRIVVPFSAGGPSDITARNVSPKMSEYLGGVPIVVDNRGGANGMIGAEIVAKSAADGYTLLGGTASITSINMVVYNKRPYDTLRDFQPLTTIMMTDTIFVINPVLPVRNLKELVALAKAHPGEPALASSGNGGILHLAMELLNVQAGIKMTHVPYKGAGPAVLEVIGGQVGGMFVDLPVVSPYIRSKRVRALVVASKKRSTYFPDVPTTTESGFPGVQVSNHYSLLLPLKTPRDIVMKLHDSVVKTMAVPEVRSKFTNIGADPLIMSPEEFTAFLKNDIEKWAKVAKASGVNVDE